MTEGATARAEKFTYYTKSRNFIVDEITPEVTENCPQGTTAMAILHLIERKARGYHQEAAEISISEMNANIRVSRSDLKRARSWLLEEGYIQILSEGNGLETSELRIVLDPTERETVKAAQRDRKKTIGIRPEHKPALIISRPTESTDRPDEHCLDIDPSNFQSDNPAANSQSERPDHPTGEEVLQTTGSEAVEPPHQTPSADQTPESESRICQYESALKASKIKGVLSDPPSREGDLVLVLGLNKKTNIATQAEIEEKKSAFGAVCSFVKSQNVRMEDRDYAFVTWIVETYGADDVSAKMQIAKRQIAKRMKFSNPLGWLRVAITRNFQHSKFDQEVSKAREKSRRQSEVWEREKAEREKHRQACIEARKNRDAANGANADFLALIGE